MFCSKSIISGLTPKRMEAKRQYGHEPACRVTKGLELLSPTAGSARPSAPTPNFRTFSLGDVWRQQRRSMETMTVVDNMAMSGASG